jgi:peptidoglycan/LPS O-acetylase OafA/YrhL
VLWPLVLAPLRRLVRARTRRDLLRRLLPALLLTGYLVWLVGPLRGASGATLAELALGTHVRAAEFLLGAVAATVVAGLRDRPVSRPVAPLLALLGTAVLVGMAVLAVRQPAEWLRSGGPTGAALGGALLLLAAHLPADGPVGSALGRGLPLELGRSAYPLLVLHLPVFWLIQQGVPTVRPAALAVAGTALAWLVGLLLQDGLVRRWRARRQPVAVASLSVLALVTVMAAGVLVHQRVADLPPDLPPDPTWARALAPRPEGRPVVLVLGGSTGGDLAAALAADPGPYAVRDATRPGCGLLVTAVPASTAARVSAHAQLPPAAGPSCAGWQQRWRAELVDYRPVAVLLDLAADAAPTRIPATAPTPCDPGFRTHYRSLVAEAVAVLAAGGSGMPVLVSGSRTRSGGATGAARCFDALVADAVATQSMLVPLDHQALLCPGGVCAEGIEFGRSAHDAAHLGAGERAVLGPWLRATVAAELAPERVAARAQPQGGTCVAVPEGEVDSADC